MSGVAASGGAVVRGVAASGGAVVRGVAASGGAVVTGVAASEGAVSPAIWAAAATSAAIALGWLAVAPLLARRRAGYRLHLLDTSAAPHRRRLPAMLSRGNLATRARVFRRSDDPPAALLAELLGAVARRCASGDSLGVAYTHALAASSLAPALQRTTAAMRAGVVLADALVTRPTDHPDLVLALHVLGLCARQGGNVSESLDRAAATLRERDGLARERTAQGAQARLSARVLTVVPVAFAVWTAATTPAVQAFMGTPLGVACLAGGAALNMIGWRWMRRIIAGSR